MLFGTKDKLARAFVKKYRLKRGKPIALRNDELPEFRRIFMNEWAGYSPDAPYESDFMRGFGCHPNSLTEGYLERREDGVEIVLRGRAADDRSVWIVLELPYSGVPKLTSKVEVLPGEPGYVRPA